LDLSGSCTSSTFSTSTLAAIHLVKKEMVRAKGAEARRKARASKNAKEKGEAGNNGGAQDNNHQPQHKSTTVPNAPPAKRQKTIYTNTMFTDSNGNPIPYCDNDDPPNPDDGKWIMNDEIERDFGQWLRKRKAAWRVSRRRGADSAIAVDAAVAFDVGAAPRATHSST